MNAATANNLASIWKSNIVSKIQLLDWMPILKRLITKDMCSRKGIIQCDNNVMFPMCFVVEESIFHLYVSCMVKSSMELSCKLVGN